MSIIMIHWWRKIKRWRWWVCGRFEAWILE